MKPNAMKLTEKESLIVEQVAQGKTNKVIAMDLGMSESTVKSHVRNVLRKAKLTNRTELALHFQQSLRGQPTPRPAPGSLSLGEPMKINCIGTVVFDYVNWRGEFSRRRCVFLRLFFGHTQWHPEPQWFVEAQDLGDVGETRPKLRHFSLRDMSNVRYAP